MALFLYEETILEELDRYCMVCARKWLKRHNFTRIDDIWDDAVQCARLGLLLYIRKRNITKAEDVFPDGGGLYWSMYNELSTGILYNACAPLGIHRPTHQIKTFRIERISMADADKELENCSEIDFTTIAISVETFMTELNDRDREIMTAYRGGEDIHHIANRLGMTYHNCHRRIQLARQKLTRYLNEES